MTKAQYLAELERQISELPATERQEILADYQEHFEMGAAAGKREEEICHSLGTPRSVAKAILVNTMVTKAESSDSISDRTRVILRVMVAFLVLAPFNFFMLICPFTVLFSVAIAGWALPLSFAGTAAALLFAAFKVMAPVGVVHALALASASLGTLGLAVMSAVIMIVVTRFALTLLISYCKWNVNFIQSRKTA